MGISFGGRDGASSGKAYDHISFESCCKRGRELTVDNSATPASGIPLLGAGGGGTGLVGVVLPNPRIIPIPAILVMGFREFPRFRMESTRAGVPDGDGAGAAL